MITSGGCYWVHCDLEHEYLYRAPPEDKPSLQIFRFGDGEFTVTGNVQDDYGHVVPWQPPGMFWMQLFRLTPNKTLWGRTMPKNYVIVGK